MSLEPLGTEHTPEDYGFPENPTLRDKRIWETQERFLYHYASSGRMIYSAKATGVHRDTVLHWRNSGLFSFQKRFDAAHDEFVESLEADIDDWSRTTKHNPQIAKIFRLKAEAPEKYREDVKIQGLEPLTSLLEEARKLAARDIQKRQDAEALSAAKGQGLEQGAAEGSYRDLDARGNSDG